MRFLLLLLATPLLLAPVRLKDASPNFFQPPAQSPAPESYSLPAAAPLTTPTVIAVSPTVLTTSPTAAPVSSTLNLPLSPSPTVSTKPQTPPPAPVSNKMSPMASALCQRGMVLVQDLAMLSYRARNNEKLMTLGLATATTVRQAAAFNWPNLAAYDKASNNLPWFQPQMEELKQAIPTARRLCTRAGNPLANQPAAQSDPILGL